MSLLFKNIFVRPLFDAATSTYSYLLGDIYSKNALLIDPVIEQVERDIQLIKELKLNLLYTLETHAHADHITGAAVLSKKLGSKIVVGKNVGVECADQLLEDGDQIGLSTKSVIKAILTPGHTNGCMSYYIDGAVFTGDALLIRGCGRTDFQQGSAETLYHSIMKKLYSLPGETVVFPGHDYKGNLYSTIKEEIKYNLRINEGVSVDKFILTMDNLNLSDPHKIHIAVPANFNCGKINK